ncbi:hypothetical protein [Nitrospira sp. Kam-Ns4a]
MSQKYSRKLAAPTDREGAAEPGGLRGETPTAAGGADAPAPHGRRPPEAQPGRPWKGRQLEERLA